MGVLTMVFFLIIEGIVALVRHLRDKNREKRGVGIDWDNVSKDNCSNLTQGNHPSGENHTVTEKGNTYK